MNQQQQDLKQRGWQIERSPDQCHRYMLDNQLSCDVNIRFPGSKDLIGAHRYMLICRSPVFEAMFSQNSLQAGGAIINLDLPDVDPDTIKEVLRYIYYDGATVLGENVISLLHAAKKYELDGLVTRCIGYLQCNLSPGNVCTLLNTCSLDEVTQLCVQYIRNHPSHVLKSTHFLGLTGAALYKLLGNDLLYDRVVVIEAAFRWAKRQWERRKSVTSMDGTTIPFREILGRCLYRLGFTSMTSSQLATVVKETAALSDTEQLALFRYAAMPDEEATSSLLAMGFPLVTTVYTSPRCYNSVLQCDIPKQAELNSTLTFTVNDEIILRGFTVFGTTKTATYRLSAELTKHPPPGQDSEVACKFQTRLWSRGSKDAIRIVLPTAVHLLPAVVYRLQMVLSDIKESVRSIYKGVDRLGQVVGEHCTLILTDAQSEDDRLIAQIIYSVK